MGRKGIIHRHKTWRVYDQVVRIRKEGHSCAGLTLGKALKC